MLPGAECSDTILSSLLPHYMLAGQLMASNNAATQIPYPWCCLPGLQVVRVYEGSVKADITFLAPPGTTLDQINTLSAAIQQTPGAFMTGGFSSRYGNVVMEATAGPASKGSGLGGGAIAGIVIGILAACALVAGATWYIRRRRQMQVVGPRGAMVGTVQMSGGYSQARDGSSTAAINRPPALNLAEP